MVFKCQEDSFLQEFTTQVTKCEPTKEAIVDYGKKSSFKGYEITLENTILFAAGGGQPHDVGWLNGVDVFQVIRKGDQALHFTKEPLEVGTVVKQQVNWDRRFDHMQQHSGQHLLSAILEKEYNLDTTSWWLGADECYIELDSTEVSDDVIAKAEARCNELIREAVPVTVKFCKIDDPDLNDTVKKGLPKDCVETIRIICIGNIDENLCCGTHVSNLSNQPAKHEELVKKLQKNFKSLNKNFQNLMFDFAKSDAQAIKSRDPKPRYVFSYKTGVPLEYLRTFRDEMKDENMLIFLAAQDVEKPNEGYVMIDGPDDICNEIAPKLIICMKAKGKLSKTGQFQGKADMGGIETCKKIVEEHFNAISCDR